MIKLGDITLYPHQEQAVVNANNYLELHRQALIVLSVGLGKSYIISALALQYKRAVILQPAMELVKQNHSKLTVAGLNSTMIDSAHKGDWSADYIYTTPQTLHKNLDKLEEPPIVFIDEAHMFYSGKMFKEIFAKWRNCKIVMLTATPYYQITKNEYSDGYMWSVSTTHSIERDLGIRACINIDREKALAMGYGCEIVYHRITKMPLLQPEYLKDIAIYKFMIEKHISNVQLLIDGLANGIIYANSIAEAEMLSQHFGFPCVFGKTKKKERALIVDNFISGKIKFVITVGCLKLGFDFPGLRNIILLSNFNNECEAEQVIGRLNRGSGTKHVWYIGKLNKNKPVPGKVTRIKLMALSDVRRKRW